MSEIEINRCNAPSQNSETGQLANLPADILQEIFRRLPLPSKIKLGRTNKRLHELSTLAIRETECIDFADVQLRKISAKEAEKLFELSANNLKRIRFPSDFEPVFDEEIEEAQRFIRVMAAFSYPKLEQLSLPGARMENDLFAKIVRKCPNLRCFEWERREEDPVWEKSLSVCPAEISKNLSTVLLGKCTTTFLRSLAERCPNLAHFQFGILYPGLTADLNQVFAHCRKVEKLNIDCAVHCLTHFWTIPSLRSLTFKHDANDHVVVRIAEHFQSLEDLELHHGDSMSSVGHAALATLPELRRLVIDRFFIRDHDEDGIEELAESGTLEEVSLIGVTKLTPATFLRFVQSCVNLRRLSLRSLKDVESAAAAVDVIRGMRGRKRDLEIEFYDTNKVTPWTAEEVMAELTEVNRRNGCTIRVTPKEYTGTDRFRLCDE